MNRPWKSLINGYPSLSAFIASDQDQSTYIFRTFKRLTARNLLYLEAELSELEALQEKYDEKDLSGSLDTKRCARSWPELSGSTNPDQIARLDLVYKIRNLLREYHEALTLSSQIAKLDDPSQNAIETLDIWSNGRHRSGTLGPIISDRSALRLTDKNDLITLRKPHEQDLLIRFIRKYLRVFFVEGEVEESMVYISEKKIALTTAIISTTIGAVLLIGSIINLYIVQNNNVRIGLIGGYTSIFALSLAVLTNARRAELFASTAAYTAVLVVFVSGNLGGGAGEGG